MQRQTSNKPDKSALVIKAAGNPEGKGTSGFLVDWHQSEPKDVVAKPQRHLLAEVFTSMLVLSATFKFRPVVGAKHYLYWINEEWSLSLIAPDEWSDKRRDGFAGTCVLQRDMTWTITPSSVLEKLNPVSDAIYRFYEGFFDKLNTDRELEEILPFYAARLPYYQRLYASAFSRSVRAALVLSNQRTASCREWALLMPQPIKLLSFPQELSG